MTPKSAPPEEPKNWNPEIRLALLEADHKTMKEQLNELKDDCLGDKATSLCSRTNVLEHDKTDAKASWRTAVAIITAVIGLGTSVVWAEVRGIKEALVKPGAVAKP